MPASSSHFPPSFCCISTNTAPSNISTPLTLSWDIPGPDFELALLASNRLAWQLSQLVLPLLTQIQPAGHGFGCRHTARRSRTPDFGCMRVGGVLRCRLENAAAIGRGLLNSPDPLQVFIGSVGGRLRALLFPGAAPKALFRFFRSPRVGQHIRNASEPVPRVHCAPTLPCSVTSRAHRHAPLPHDLLLTLRNFSKLDSILWLPASGVFGSIKPAAVLEHNLAPFLTRLTHLPTTRQRPPDASLLLPPPPPSSRCAKHIHRSNAIYRGPTTDVSHYASCASMAQSREKSDALSIPLQR
ncbi:hypothetical protein B0H15DRAFT_996901 [Mycena belliarum]|uniref:Uncharacterized protein n=1 Tax=Mycena belliarum TaxID=1033014 RepID=A0AAD6XKB8_9AGAR|nr:hypothetical protein B0H15DRAFT_996901 [Mycena belliae]